MDPTTWFGGAFQSPQATPDVHGQQRGWLHPSPPTEYVGLRPLHSNPPNVSWQLLFVARLLLAQVVPLAFTDIGLLGIGEWKSGCNLPPSSIIVIGYNKKV